MKSNYIIHFLDIIIFYYDNYTKNTIKYNNGGQKHKIILVTTLFYSMLCNYKNA